MKVLICDNKKIKYQSIPKAVKDYFVIEYVHDDGSETINLVAENDEWVIKSDKAITVFQDNALLPQITLKEYNFFDVVVTSLNLKLNIYVIPDIEKYNKFSVNGLTEITFGQNNTHIVSNYLTSPFSIKKSEQGYFIENPNPNNGRIYVNKKIITKNKLKLGDVIFTNGIKIIWMDTYIKVNNPNNTVICNQLTYVSPATDDKCSYTPITEAERNSKLYSENDVFFHIPRLHSIVKEEVVKIELPPDKDHSQKTPAILSVGASAVLGLTSVLSMVSVLSGMRNGNQDPMQIYIQLAVCVLMLIGSLVFPIALDRWQKRQDKKHEKLRQTRYTRYLTDKADEINKIIETQKQIITENNISLEEIGKRIVGKSQFVWGREIKDEDFLSVRLGIGDLKAKIKIEAPEKSFSLYDDNLKDKALKLAQNEYMVKEVPVTISMIENKVTPFIFGASFKDEFISGIMLQLLYYYSAMDLKIVVLTNEENASKWEYLKYTQYCFSSDKQIRFFSTNDNELSQISIYLEQEYDKRANKDINIGTDEHIEDIKEKYKMFSEYFLIVTDDFKEIKSAPIIDKILNDSANLGFSLLIFENSLSNLPNRVEHFVEIQNNISGLYSRNLNDGEHIKFKADYLADSNIDKYVQILGNIPIETKSNQLQLPKFLTFLDLFKVGKISQLNILTKWKENNPINSLNANIGLKEGNKLIGLDLHEKYHGPHGLIAGSTGSGKSEFIITYILSMAVNYSPDEVQFVLIDYKGGGLAGAFENKETGLRLPHLIGTITNLDTAEMNRSLVSIQSELKRRQRIFNETRDKLGESTIDIYKYQQFYREGKVDKPLSHLFIISDEFAELKQQQPEFMDELVSTARIGRSLGVHLVLATQKPAGVVNDQIWSNSHFKVCLKVQTTEDSQEVLKRPEASEIKETGRFYLQVGNNELFELGQSAWAGAKYIPSDRYEKKIDDGIDFVSNDGQIYKTVNNEITDANVLNSGEQVTNVVKYLYDLANEEKYNFNYLWLPSIPGEIYLGNIIKKYSFNATPYDFKAVVGEYDKPKYQKQGLYTLDLTCRNTLIVGTPGSGKENLLNTIIYSICSFHKPDEIYFYALDFGSGSLNVFSKMPHFGDIISSSDGDKIAAQFEFLQKELRKRKELFAEYSGDYKQYCEKSGKKVPLIVTIINGYESFEESNNTDSLLQLLRDGSKYGIVFIATTTVINIARNYLGDYFNNKILLQIQDNYDYQYILGADRNSIPKKLFGRGMTVFEDEACEFQTSYIYLKDEINDIIRSVSKQLASTYQVSAPSIKSLPQKVDLNKLLKFSLNVNKVPIGYSLDTADLAYYDFIKNRVSFISGKTIIDDLSFMCSIIDLMDAIPNIKVNLFDLLMCVSTDGNLSCYYSDFNEPFKQILDNTEPQVNIILGVGDYKSKLMFEELDLFENILNNIDKLDNQVFIFIDNYDRLQNIIKETWFTNIKHDVGIWQGNDFDEQNIFDVKEYHNYDLTDDARDIAYLIEDGAYESIKCVGTSGGFDEF